MMTAEIGRLAIRLSAFTLTFAAVQSAAAFDWWVPFEDRVNLTTDAARAPLGVMAEGYLNNRALFDAFTCRWRLTKAKANSIEDALEGKLFDRIESDGTWLVKGDKTLIKIGCDKRLVERAMVEGMKQAARQQADGQDGVVISIPCSSEEYLRNGPDVLRHASEIASGNLYPDGRDHPGVRNTPFSMGVMVDNEQENPGVNLRQSLDGHLTGKFEGTAEIRGISTMVASLEVNPGGYACYKYWLAPEQGFLPVRLRTWGLSGRLVHDAHILEARRFTNGGWFPMHSVVIQSPEAKPPFIVYEFQVTELDVENPPGDAKFHLDVPAGTQMSTPGRSGHTFTLTKDERISADDLQRLNARIGEAGLRYEQAPRAALAPTPVPGGSGIITTASIALGVLAVVGAAWWYRTRWA